MTTTAEPAVKLLLLHEDDTVFVCAGTVRAGERVTVGDAAVVAAADVEIGHKVARRDLSVGDKVVKYGAPIGSMTEPVGAGGHVHVHNMKSDYIPSHRREGEDAR